MRITQRAPRGKISLIEYAICRLEKMNNERAYCAREFLAYSPIRQIIANLTILKGVDRVGGYEVELTLGDFGLEPNTYPEIPLFKPFFNRNPTWDPKKIRSVTP